MTPRASHPAHAAVACAVGCSVVVFLAACGGTTTQGPTPTPAPTPSSAAGQTARPTPSPSPTPEALPAPFADTDTQAYVAWESASGSDRDLLARIALTPQARWIGDWYADDAAVTA